MLRTTSEAGWRDQWVLAAGTAWQPVERLTLWAGYNYGRNPIPNDHLTPLLANISQHHVTAGTGWRLAEGARLGLAIEYQFPNDVDYDNAELRLGSDLRARTAYVALHLGLGLAW